MSDLPLVPKPANPVRAAKVEKLIADQYSELRLALRDLLREHGIPNTLNWTDRQILEGLKRALKR